MSRRTELVMALREWVFFALVMVIFGGAWIIGAWYAV
jgi:hypothetical protein